MGKGTGTCQNRFSLLIDDARPLPIVEDQKQINVLTDPPPNPMVVPEQKLEKYRQALSLELQSRFDPHLSQILEYLALNPNLKALADLKLDDDTISNYIELAVKDIDPRTRYTLLKTLCGNINSRLHREINSAYYCKRDIFNHSKGAAYTRLIYAPDFNLYDKSISQSSLISSCVNDNRNFGNVELINLIAIQNFVGKLMLNKYLNYYESLKEDEVEKIYFKTTTDVCNMQKLFEPLIAQAWKDGQRPQVNLKDKAILQASLLYPNYVGYSDGKNKPGVDISSIQAKIFELVGNYPSHQKLVALAENLVKQGMAVKSKQKIKRHKVGEAKIGKAKDIPRSQAKLRAFYKLVPEAKINLASQLQLQIDNGLDCNFSPKTKEQILKSSQGK